MYQSKGGVQYIFDSGCSLITRGESPLVIFGLNGPITT